MGLKSENKFPEPTVSVKANSVPKIDLSCYVNRMLTSGRSVFIGPLHMPFGMILVTTMNFSKKVELFIFCRKTKKAEHFACI